MREVLFSGENSLIAQSRHAAEQAAPVNGDGFGVGFYLPDVHPEPAVFVSTSPAWNNRNIHYNATRVRSGCLFAHVRAASHGEVAEMNCHPFRHGRLLMMHNGNVGDFRAIKRRLRRGLSDEAYHWVKGQTDSEHLFAVFVDRLREAADELTPRSLADALLSTIARLRELGEQCGVVEPSLLNLAVTDGQSIVATRYVSHPSLAPPSLYYAAPGLLPGGGEGEPRSEVAGDPAGAIIASEKLGGDAKQWHAVPRNHLVSIDRELRASIETIDDRAACGGSRS